MSIGLDKALLPEISLDEWPDWVRTFEMNADLNQWTCRDMVYKQYKYIHFGIVTSDTVVIPAKYEIIFLKR